MPDIDKELAEFKATIHMSLTVVFAAVAAGGAVVWMSSGLANAPEIGRLQARVEQLESKVRQLEAREDERRSAEFRRALRP